VRQLQLTVRVERGLDRFLNDIHGAPSVHSS
jgi:hypothetical protein